MIGPQKWTQTNEWSTLRKPYLIRASDSEVYHSFNKFAYRLARFN